MAKKQTKKVRRAFIFNQVQDAELLAALDSLPDGEKSQAVRQALRLFFGQQKEKSPVLGEVILTRLDEIQAAIEALRQDGVKVTDPDANHGHGDDDDIAPGIRNTLLNLGL